MRTNSYLRSTSIQLTLHLFLLFIFTLYFLQFLWFIIIMLWGSDGHPMGQLNVWYASSSSTKRAGVAFPVLTRKVCLCLCLFFVLIYTHTIKPTIYFILFFYSCVLYVWKASTWHSPLQAEQCIACYCSTSLTFCGGSSQIILFMYTVSGIISHYHNHCNFTWFQFWTCVTFFFYLIEIPSLGDSIRFLWFVVLVSGIKCI